MVNLEVYLLALLTLLAQIQHSFYLQVVDILQNNFTGVPHAEQCHLQWERDKYKMDQEIIILIFLTVV